MLEINLIKCIVKRVKKDASGRTQKKVHKTFENDENCTSLINFISQAIKIVHIGNKMSEHKFKMMRNSRRKFSFFSVFIFRVTQSDAAVFW